MFTKSQLTYSYDGSFDGLMCCVFESFLKKEVPVSIFSQQKPQLSLMPQKEIPTDSERAHRVFSFAERKMGAGAPEFIKKAFLTCEENRELLILHLFHLGNQYGSSMMNMLTDDTVCTLKNAVRRLDMEVHHLLGFVRFSESGGILFSEIEPKNFVLPLMAQHFCERFPEEKFLIYDKTNRAALIYQPYRCEIICVSAITIPDPDEKEKMYRSLWKTFHEAIEIRERHNPLCQRTHLPIRFRNEMTEFTA